MTREMIQAELNMLDPGHSKDGQNKPCPLSPSGQVGNHKWKPNPEHENASKLHTLAWNSFLRQKQSNRLPKQVNPRNGHDRIKAPMLVNWTRGAYPPPFNQSWKKSIQKGKKKGQVIHHKSRLH